jgi:L-iditol 2-dehydrogenase
MRALVLHGPGRYGVETDWPVPQPRPGWALVKVTHAGICGSDLPRFVATGSYHHPMILGHEFAGIVQSPAPDSTRYAGGEAVGVLPIIPCGTCPACRQDEPFHCRQYQFLGSRNDGGFAEYCLVPEDSLFPLPAGFELRQGALLEPLAVALHVARRCGLTAGQTALVLGAGPIGLLVAQWLRVFGARHVTVADVRPASLDLAKALGFDHVIDPRAADWETMPQFDVTVEAAGALPALLTAIERTTMKGTIALVGRDTSDTHIPLKDVERLMRKELKVLGCWGYRMAGEHAFVGDMLREGRFALDGLITHEISLEEAPDMIRAMADRRLHYCKVIIDIWKHATRIKETTTAK